MKYVKCCKNHFQRGLCFAVVPIAERNEEGKVVRKKLEVDFVCNIGSKRYYIQSAYSIPDNEKKNKRYRSRVIFLP